MIWLFWCPTLKVRVSIYQTRIHSQTYSQIYILKYVSGGPRGVVVKAMDYEIVVREFVLQLRYYVHFRANTLWKVMNSLILPAMG